MRIAVVDDERKWIEEILKVLQKQVESVDNIDIYESGVDFLNNNKEYDVVLMDVQMDIKDGFATIEEYSREFPDSINIFLTTQLDLARRGYLVDAFRYIDKSNMDEEIEEAFIKIREINKKNKQSLIGVKGDTIKNIFIKDIMYIDTFERNSLIHTDEEKYRCDKKINDLEKELEQFGFYRCHKSFLINLGKVEKLDKEFAYFPNGEKAYLSVRRYTETKKKYISERKKYAFM